MANKKSKLTVKQRTFAQLYVKTGNATQSFLDAGFKASKKAAGVRAFELLNYNENVKAYVAELLEKAQNEAIADIQELQQTLTKIIREELDEEQLMTVGTGEGYSEIVTKRKKAALKDRLRAIELLTRMKGGFVDKVEVNGAQKVVFVDDLKD